MPEQVNMRHLKRNPLVSCIMPTRDRRFFVARAIKYFLRQDHANRELIIVDDGADPVGDLVPQDQRFRYLRLGHKIPIGAKRNLACANARGEVVAHWDDDDWMADWRLSYQVRHLVMQRADICGLHTTFYLDAGSGQAWQHVYPQSRKKPWVTGATLCYTKAFWQTNPFLNINVGEDTRFLWSDRRKRVALLSKPSFYVALIHPGNTSPKQTSEGWFACPTGKIQRLMGADWSFYAALKPGRRNENLQGKVLKRRPHASRDKPLVSCVMATYNRRRFITRAIQYYLRQDYPNRELIIIDDGEDVVKDLVPKHWQIRYFQLSEKHSLGVKRNLGCGFAKGEFVIFWDDDDWYASDRISYQMAPLLEGQADMTALGDSLMFCLSSRQFWRCEPALHERMFLYGALTGTLAFRKEIWLQGKRFPDYSVAEEAAFVKDAVRKGARLQKLDNRGTFVYMRHDDNTWQFKIGEHGNADGWQQVEHPTFIPEGDLQFYGVTTNAATNKSNTDKIKRTKQS